MNCSGEEDPIPYVPRHIGRYDDWWSIACGALGLDADRAAAAGGYEAHGEMRAHAEIAARHEVEFACACGSCALPATGGACDSAPLWGAVFVVQALGRGRTSTGFMPADEQLEWARRSPRCVALAARLSPEPAQQQ